MGTSTGNIQSRGDQSRDPDEEQEREVLLAALYRRLAGDPHAQLQERKEANAD